MIQALQNPHALANEALIALRNGDKALGFIGACHAVVHPKAGQRELLIFSEAVNMMKVVKFEPIVRDALLVYFASDRVDHRKALILWFSLLQYDPSVKIIIEYISAGKFTADDWPKLESALCDPIITEVIRLLILSEPKIEILFRQIRRVMLLDLWPAGTLRTKHLSFLCSLAEHCFFNEYAYFTSQEELAALCSLPKDNAIAVALRGCYEPLHGQKINPKISAVVVFKRMVEALITEPGREEYLEKNITSFGIIEDEVSKNVRAMYEENPYPRWRTINFPVMPEVIANGTVLIAGCGTGRTSVQCGVAFPNVNITSIDITRRSIAYAKRMCEKYGVSNIEFRHGDIMNLDMLDKKFDFIESGGVLHHMADPVAGWKKLVDALAPGGRMIIGLYSTKARVNIQKTRDYIREQGYKSKPDDIRRLRAEILETPGHPLLPLTYSRDFFTLSEMRDLVFHVQETTYTIPELKDIMASLGLEFMRMRMPRKASAALYREKFPDDPEMANIDNWDEFEDEYRGTFASMYNLVCKKAGDDTCNDSAHILMMRLYEA